MDTVNSDWGRFFLLCLLGAVLIAAAAAGLFAWNRKKAPGKVSDLPLRLLLAFAPFCIGLFHVWGSGICSLLLMAYLIYALTVTGKLTVILDERLLMTVLIALAYGLCSFWAVDRGLAPVGFVKFLPLPLAVLCVQQLSGEDRADLLRWLPLSGAVMVLLSGALLLVEPCRSWLLYRGRLAGFFQYPNTFALYLLCCLILVVSESRGARRLLLTAVLFGGILATGSRTVLLLAVFLGLLWALSRGTARSRVLVGASVAAVVLGVVGLGLLLPNSPVGRLLSISLKTENFLTRLLYYRDALPVIARHPFGLGYLGYYYSQGSFQTGSYHVMFAHNDLLQLLLDVGWLPALGAAGVLLRQLLRRKGRDRLLLAAILGHAMLDFSLQYVAIWLILLAVCGGGHEFGRFTCTNKAITVSVCAVLAACSVSLGASNYLENRSPTGALVCYPNNTAALYNTMLATEDTAVMGSCAQRILELDPYVSVAHSARAALAFQSGNVPEFLSEKKKAIACARYTRAEYQDYFDKLSYILALYDRQQDTASAEYCIGQLRQIPVLIRQTYDSTSTLGWAIKEKPNLELTEESTAFLSSLTQSE